MDEVVINASVACSSHICCNANARSSEQNCNAFHQLNSILKYTTRTYVYMQQAEGMTWQKTASEREGANKSPISKIFCGQSKVRKRTGIEFKEKFDLLSSQGLVPLLTSISAVLAIISSELGSEQDAGFVTNSADNYCGDLKLRNPASQTEDLPHMQSAKAALAANLSLVL